MNCVSYCLIATVLLISNIVIMLTCNYDSKFKDFKKCLNYKQADIYKSIINERVIIYIKGIILGILLGLILVVLLKKTKRYSKICLFVVVVLLTPMFYYKLTPKSKYMIQYLNSTQINKWLGLYTTIKFRGALSIVISAIAYILLGFACC